MALRSLLIPASALPAGRAAHAHEHLLQSHAHGGLVVDVEGHLGPSVVPPTRARQVRLLIGEFDRGTPCPAARVTLAAGNERSTTFAIDVTARESASQHCSRSR